MKKKMIKAALEEVCEQLSAEHLNEMTNLFRLVSGDADMDAATVAVVRSRVNIYLETWILPKIEKVLDELK